MLENTETCSVTSKVWVSQVIAPAGVLISEPERLVEHPSSLKILLVDEMISIWSNSTSLMSVNWLGEIVYKPIRLTQWWPNSNPLGITRFFFPNISVSFKRECYILMQMQHTKNLNPERCELGSNWVKFLPWKDIERWAFGKANYEELTLEGSSSSSNRKVTTNG